MQSSAQSTEAPASVFAQKLAASLSDGSFVRLVLSKPIPSNEPEKVLGRCIELRGEPHLSLTFRYATRDEVKNLPIKEAIEWLASQVGSSFPNALLGTTRADWQLSAIPGRAVRLTRHKAASKQPPARTHDQSRNSILDASANDWLAGLGVTDRAGQVRSGMADKHAQISRYLEIISHVAKESGWLEKDELPSEQRNTIADMGCGKAYLTFGLWHLFHRVYQRPFRIIGVDARPELVASNQALAHQIGATGLEFVSGTIDSTPLGPLRGLIALHACNTATDDAIRRGIEAQAQLIVVAPCCHKELRPQLGRPAPLEPLLRHGLMEERLAEWLTDGLRALFLEWAGYQTKVLEFVSLEHTAKNVMLIASRKHAPFADLAARQRIEELKSFFGVQHHTLDPLLAQAAAPLKEHGLGQH